VDVPTRTGDTHNYAECANKGDCNRATGECDCFPGYEGKACGRQSCPDECSGHGTCELMKDLTFGNTFHDYNDGSSYVLSGLGTGGKVLADLSWDSERARTCVCDGGWTGLKCNLRMCPVGNDIMDVLPSGEVRQVQTITLFDAIDDNTRFGTQTFGLQFTSMLNETLVTQPIRWVVGNDPLLQTYIESALMKLPNKVIDEVDVNIDSSSGSAGVVIHITFSGNTVQGTQHKIEVLADNCGEGCTPRRTGLTNLRSYHATDLSIIEVSTAGSHESFECGRRGKCAYSTGICACYDGFAGDACNIFNAAL